MRRGVFPVPRNCRILFAVSNAGNAISGQDGFLFLGNREHAGLGLSTVKEDSNRLSWFKHVAFADDLPVPVGDDTVTARQYGGGVEVRQPGRQAFHAGEPHPARLICCIAQTSRQDCQAVAWPVDGQATYGQSVTKCPQFAVGVGAGVSPRGEKLALPLLQADALGGEVVRGWLQAARQTVDLLFALLELALEMALQRGVILRQATQERFSFRCRDFGGRGGRGRALVGDEIGDGDIGFMSDATDNR